MSAVVYRPDAVYAEGVLRRGPLCVGADGRVLASIPPGAVEVPLPGRVLLPGLVNAHSHAFQRVMRSRTEFRAAGLAHDDFWTWREAMYAAAESLTPDEVYAVSRQAFVEMALAGITTVGEFHYLHHQVDGTPYADPSELALQVVRAARDVGLRIVLLRVLYGRAGFGVQPNPRQRRFIDPDVEVALARVEALRAAVRADALVSVGHAPHSVRAVSPDWLRRVAQAIPSGVVHLHVAEQLAEVRACLAETTRRPVELLDEVGLLRPGVTAVHAVHVTDDEIQRLARGGVAVCACPSTERNLGDGVVQADAMAHAGVSLALGSDSQAQIDLLDETRLLEGQLRLIRGQRNILPSADASSSGLGRWLLDLATAGGARSLGVETGTLGAGTPADFFTVDTSHPTLLGTPGEALLAAVAFSAPVAAVRDVAVQGRVVVREGRHVLQEQSARAFAGVMQRLS